jgi:hypothetical protein
MADVTNENEAERREQLQGRSHAHLVEKVLRLEYQKGSFKRRVASKAWEYAQRYNWCDQVRECLAELGIELGYPQIEATVVVTYKIRGQVPYDDLVSVESMGAENFVQQHLHVPALQLVGAIIAPDQQVDPSLIHISGAEIKAPEVLG